ncbi:MAG TPA: serine hydrolase [Vicinamibacterales bacterium]|nr:serine hydrolase [Vicinamibacterales bacterium]
MRMLFTLLSFVSAAALAKADAPAFTFPRSTPEAQGVSSAALLQFVDEAERGIDALHSLMVVRRGHVIAEGWWAPYEAAEPHMMFSLSKSFTSTAVGLAVAEGGLTIDDPVLKFFPDLAPADPSASLRAMRVRDLLTMTAGHHEEDLRAFPYDGERDPAKVFLELPVAHKPGTFFVYSSPASYMLSAIVQKVTGQHLVEYLRPRLFEPLGIENPTWQTNRHGVAMGSFGLSIRTEDIARFGQLYLQRGQWQGRQLVPAEWIDLATSRQVSNGSSPESDWEQGYGFQFWRTRHGFYRGDGAHGQFCLILPQYDTVIAITSGTRDMASVMNHVWERLLPALKPEALPDDPAAHRQLTQRLQKLTLPVVRGGRPASFDAKHVGRRYAFDLGLQKREESILVAPPEAIERLVLDRADANGAISLTLRMHGVDHTLAATPGTWTRGRLETPRGPQVMATSGGWTSPDTYTLKVVFLNTPFRNTYHFRFAGDQVFLRRERNVGPQDARILELTGRAVSTATASGVGRSVRPAA